MVKVYSHDILMQEVPGEVSLSLSISNCPYKCLYCHTPELQRDVGEDFYTVIDELLEKYKDGITTVLFMGGDSNIGEIMTAADYVKEKSGLKTAVYLGRSEYGNSLLEHFDYLKVGPYIHTLGGLSSPTTNQRMYKIVNNQKVDITHRFWRDNK